jgi:outer membrane protein assembly factor BamB
MKSVLRSSLFAAACLFASVSIVHAAETSSWPAWRGTTGTGVAPGAQPPIKWSDQQNIKWKAKIPGLGYSTPIIWKDRIYLLTAIETNEGGAAPAAATNPPPAADRPEGGPPKGGKRGGPGGGKGGGGFGGGGGPTKVHEFAVIALDRSTGKIIWQKTARRELPHEGRHDTNTFASASPLTDGEHLYVPFGSRGFYCYDLNGNLKWEKDLGDMRTKLSFGEGSSPALAGDLLIINWDHEGGSYIVALNKKTGSEVWRTPRDDSTSWSTPLVVEHQGRAQAIIPASKKTRSYDVKTGETIWEASGLGANVIAMPVTGHGLVYVMSGYQRPAIQAIKLTARGDVSEKPDVVWSVRQNGPYIASPVLSGDRLYVTKDRTGNLSCFNALTGEYLYQDQPLPGIRVLYASPLLAGGHLYIAGREGTIVVVKDAPKFEVVATNKLGEGIDASPVALDRELFLRGHEHLYCISES